MKCRGFVSLVTQTNQYLRIYLIPMKKTPLADGTKHDQGLDIDDVTRQARRALC